MAAKKNTKELSEYEVKDAFASCSSLMLGGVEVRIKDGKVCVSESVAKYLKEMGYLK